MARTTVYLVRHGESSDERGLTARGRNQAHRLGERLREVPFADVHHSALLRAAETAAILSRYLPAVPTHVCAHAADRTPWLPDVPPRYQSFLDQVPEDERDVDAVGLRAAVEHLGRTGVDDRHQLVVTHAFVIGWFVRHALDAPPWRWLSLSPANAAVTVVRFDDDAPPALAVFNDTGHLPIGPVG